MKYIIPLLLLALTGCQSVLMSQHKPVLETVDTVLEAHERAQAYAAAIPGARVSGFFQTGSMLHTFPGDAFVVVEPYPFSAIRAGDLVACQADTGDAFAHWVLGWSLGGLLTYGDSNRNQIDRFPSYGRVPNGKDRFDPRATGRLYSRNVDGVIRRGWLVKGQSTYDQSR